jgi:ATP adenylyltransferase
MWMMYREIGLMSVTLSQATLLHIINTQAVANTPFAFHDYRSMQSTALGISETLSKLVQSRYNHAKASGSLVFAESETTIVKTSTGASVGLSLTWINEVQPAKVLQFQLRFCPSLAKKPTPKTGEQKEKKIDPFENPTRDLFIAAIPGQSPSHVLVLNKFPIIAEHFILATKAFKQQTDALEVDDFVATLACLKAWEDDNDAPRSKRLFAFFNSGTHSGASQPHRHIQFLPVESTLEGYGDEGWTQQLVALLGAEPSESMSSSDCRCNHADRTY